MSQFGPAFDAAQRAYDNQEEPSGDNQAAFAEAYWEWLRDERERAPLAEEFGLSDSQADGIGRQCEIEQTRLEGAKRK